jgi:hypothetical protein
MKTITIEMSHEMDNALNCQIEMLSSDGIIYTKEQYILSLLTSALVRQAAELINEGRVL